MSRWIRPRWCGVLERLGDRQHDPDGLLLLEDLVLVEVVLDRRPFDVLHHEVVVAVDLAGVDRVDDVVVRELGGDLGLALEPLDELLVLGQGVEQDLDGDDPVDADLLGLVDDPHRALAELLDDLVAGDLELARWPRPISCSSRIIWLRVRTLASTMISSRLLDDSLSLAASLVRCDLHASISAAVASPRRRIDFSRFDFVEAGEPLRDPCPGELLSTEVAMQAVSLIPATTGTAETESRLSIIDWISSSDRRVDGRCDELAR